MRRFLLALTCVLLASTRPLAQTAPVVAWSHPGANVTHFELVIGSDAKWVINVGLPTVIGGYEYALPTLPSGTYPVTVRACYGPVCQDASTLTIVKMVATGSTALNFYWVSPTGAAASLGGVQE